MSRPLAPPPTTPPPSGEFGPVPAAGTQGMGMPAPPTQPNPGAMQDATDVMSIVQAARSLATNHPQIVPEMQQINDLMQQVQMKIVQALPPAEVAAPPV